MPEIRGPLISPMLAVGFPAQDFGSVTKSRLVGLPDI